MIGSLRGLLLERIEESGRDEVLVDVAGVGYRVVVTPTTALRLGEVGTEVFVHVHHHIREGDQTLYGFMERAERSCFEALLSAHGVGPSLALAVLGVHGPVELARLLA
ncbi:MAG TPA: Holliday junction branch migration protein RuvA, partial [Acidimicrobiaceae bacterium]|nr:Holliday junction branch migration protein RuvA [Acidimicrobiaceae bacterium]